VVKTVKVVARPIDMIVYITHEGSLNPVRFRVKNEDDSDTVIKVDKVIFTDREKIAGNDMLIFRCRSLIDGIERIYEIKYEIRTCKWILFKI
jgi:hypothetical protein